MNLFFWGSNTFGQLCSNHFDDSALPLQLEKKIESIQSLSCGGNHICWIEKDSQDNRLKVFACGDNQFGQLWINPNNNDNNNNDNDNDNDDKKRFSIPKEISFFISRDVKEFYCGWEFSLCITNENQLYVCGKVCENVVFREPTLLIQNEERRKFVSAACGMRHFLVLTEQGKVFGMGESRFGQLGCIEKEILNLIEIGSFGVDKTDNNLFAIQIACGRRHSIVLCRNATLFGFGSNRNSQLGHEIEKQRALATPTPIDLHLKPTTRIKQIYCLWDATVVHFSDKTITIFGKNSFNICSSTEKQLKFEKIACGSEHILGILSENNELIAWGWNEHGQLGDGSLKTPSNKTIKVLFNNSNNNDDNNNVLNIWCGGGFSVALK